MIRAGFLVVCFPGCSSQEMREHSASIRVNSGDFLVAARRLPLHLLRQLPFVVCSLTFCMLDNPRGCHALKNELTTYLAVLPTGKCMGPGLWRSRL